MLNKVKSRLLSGKNKLFTLILLAIITIFSNCQKEPSASFTVSSSSVNIGENVIFTNTSLDANSYLWDFGDDGSSITESPSHTYNIVGTYTVTLTAFSKNVNKKDIATKEITVSPLKPTLTTSSVTSITQTSAVCGGNVTNDGGTTVTARGVCWSTSQNPTTSNSHTTDGDGTGSFTSSITNLSVGITYYVRAYATNSAGTDYGNQINFITNPSISPTVTSSISYVTQTTATCEGNVTSDGGATVTARGVCWSTSQNPTTYNSHTTDGTGTGSFTSKITGLSASTTYYVRAYATNSKGTAYGENISFTTVVPVTDYDDNVYQTVQIGNQIWMAENLKTTHYSNGNTITEVYVYNNDENNVAIYGRLYTWAAAMSGTASSNTNPSGVQGVCPTGWHLPSDAEWTELSDFLGGTNIAGGKLKETGCGHWKCPNSGATNESGFTALPGGCKLPWEWGLGKEADLWGATEHGSSSAWKRYLYYADSKMTRYSDSKSFGYSVRCVRDN